MENDTLKELVEEQTDGFLNPGLDKEDKENS